MADEQPLTPGLTTDSTDGVYTGVESATEYNGPVIINRCCPTECDGNTGLRAEVERLTRQRDHLANVIGGHKSCYLTPNPARCAKGCEKCRLDWIEET